MFPRYFPPPPPPPKSDTLNSVPGPSSSCTRKKDYFKTVKAFGLVKKPPTPKEFTGRRTILNNMLNFTIDDNPMIDFVYNWSLTPDMLKFYDNSNS